MRKIKDLSLEEQNERNEILAELNALANKRDLASTERKLALTARHNTLMGITDEDKSVWADFVRRMEQLRHDQRQAKSRQKTRR